MNKLTAIFQALQQGKALADAVRAKNWQLAFNAGGALLLLLLNFAPLFGVPVPAFITVELVNQASLFFGPLVNWYLTAASTDKVGPLGSLGPTAPDVPQEEQRF